MMKDWLVLLADFVESNKDDLEYLLFFGIPAGIVSIIFANYFSFARLF